MTVTWVILADRARVAIRRQRTLGGPFELVQELAPSAGPRGHEAKAFAREIAGELATARTAQRFDALVLVAEPGFLALLRDALDHATRRRVRSEIPEQLLDASDAELARQIEAAR